MAKVIGFFSDEELDSVGLNGPGSGVCEQCGLSVGGCKTPQMGYVGKGEKGILIVAECPSAADDRSGKPMTGETSEWFRDKLKAKGIDIDRDCWKTNAVGCHPASLKDKQPTKAHVKHCHPRLMKTIAELKPKFIWLLGELAIHSYYHTRESNCSPTRWRGTCIPDPDRKAWILPMYHPAYALSMEKDDHFQATFNKDISHAIRCSKFPDPPEAMSISGVTILKKYVDVIDALTRVLELEPEKLAIDYETTGLKPYREAHRIATASFCYDYDHAYAFPYQYRQHFTQEQQDNIADLWEAILVNGRIKKIAHNSKFEEMWTREIFGFEIQNLWWCSMNAAHILDSRTEFSGLKFQALIRWGVPNYDADIEKYLKAVGKTPFNRVMEAPLNDLLLYNGIDSLLTFRLQEEQEGELTDRPKMEEARKFFMEGLNVLCNMQETGIHTNHQYYVDEDKRIGDRIESMKAKLHSFPEAQEFLQARHRAINFGSSPDLSDLFFNILKLPTGKLTGGGKACVDASVLATLDTPIAKEITAISKLNKIKGTYLGQFIREEEDDGKIHPFYDLHTTNTLRGSSSNPNFQNIPVRDFEAMSITRGGIIPTWGFCLEDWDYSSMEVRIIACITQDPVLMAYIEDPTTDMHRDQAKELFGFTDKEWNHMVEFGKANPQFKRAAKDIRFHTKNGMVFALFYGSYYRSIARSIFPLLKTLTTGECSLFEHLRSKGIIRSLSTAYDDFENHVKRVEQKFWFRFKVVKKWQEAAFKSYLEKGYIEYLTGFRISGWLTRNDICNYPVQGPAFHCLVWSLIQLDQRMKDHIMDSRLVGQIHDCCLGDIKPSEHDMWCMMSHEIATKEIREAHPWIIVPLDIEFEKGEINEPWSLKKEFFPNLLVA